MSFTRIEAAVAVTMTGFMAGGRGCNVFPLRNPEILIFHPYGRVLVQNSSHSLSVPLALSILAVSGKIGWKQRRKRTLQLNEKASIFYLVWKPEKQRAES